MRFSYCCGVLLLLWLNFAKNDAKFNNNKKKIKLVQLKECPNEGTSRVKWVIRKFNRTTEVNSIYINLSETIDDTAVGDIELRRWSDGGWKNNFIHFRKEQICSTLFFLCGPSLGTLLSAAGRKAGCPMEKGYVAAENFSLDLDKTPLGITTGRFMAIVKIKKKNRVFYCNEVLLDMVER